MARSIYGIDINKISPKHSITRSDIPVLIIHGENDNVVPV
jgi:dipeptidyl aminopeptidase/acylaminoacyl peptidase